MANKENLPPNYTAPLLANISPSNKPELRRQRDHSACRRPETPLRVRKTRENLKQAAIYSDIPHPCLCSPDHNHNHHGCAEEKPLDTSTENNKPLQLDNGRTKTHYHLFPPNYGSQYVQTSINPQSQPLAARVQRQKSVSRRMLSKFKENISNRLEGSLSVRPTDSDTSLVYRLSGRRRESSDAERRAQSFDLSRVSIESGADDAANQSFTSTTHVGQRSFTSSTVSTDASLDEHLGQNDSNHLAHLGPTAAIELPAIQNVPSSSSAPASPQPTPRPPRETVSATLACDVVNASINVPCVDLEVALDHSTIDASSKRDVWVSMKATIHSKTTRPPSLDADHADFLAEDAVDDHMRASTMSNGHHLGEITSLRLCYKPVEGCRIREIIGQKYMRNLKQGQVLQLFIKLRVPRLNTDGDRTDVDQDSLFAELESIVGTLETEVLHVEARYRHSLLPTSNIVTVRHICRVKRPKIESRWSVVGSIEDVGQLSHVNRQLASYLATQYPPAQALECIEQYLDSNSRKEIEVAEIRRSLFIQLHQTQGPETADFHPSVVVTDIDLDPSITSVPVSEQFSTTTNTPSETDVPSKSSVSAKNLRHAREPSALSLARPPTLAPPLISAPKTTIAVSAGDPDDHEQSQTEDSARKLWRHIRHSSLSSKQLEELRNQGLQYLEADDDILRERRQKALANKRSIGAETLKGWKWEESLGERQRHGEAPWM